MNNDDDHTNSPPPPPTTPDHHTPSLVPRCRRAATEDLTDRDTIRWIARFRFVTAEVLALHLGVTRQRALTRARRLADAGLLERRSDAPQQAWTITATRRGMAAVGLPPRRPPRTDLQREHEIALAWLVTRMEARGATVRTERECRALEQTTGVRHSADVDDPHDRSAKRWPDLIVERTDGRRLVLELERTLKGSTRLKRIIDAYRRADWFDEVRLLCVDPVIARTIATLVHPSDDDLLPAPTPAGRPAIVVAPWPGLAPAHKLAVQQAIERVARPAGRPPS